MKFDVTLNMSNKFNWLCLHRMVGMVKFTYEVRELDIFTKSRYANYHNEPWEV